MPLDYTAVFAEKPPIFHHISRMKWITREHPKIDRLACPWLIRRFVDKNAEILYAPFDQVIPRSGSSEPFHLICRMLSIPTTATSVLFDYIIKNTNCRTRHINLVADVVRGADTDRHDIAAQASGLWAISAGIAHNIHDDYKLLEVGMVIYDGLYSWAKHLQDVRHTQNPIRKPVPPGSQESSEGKIGQTCTSMGAGVKRDHPGPDRHKSYVES